jgi:anaerobic selenocysteine-containing dehydrogenase
MVPSNRPGPSRWRRSDRRVPEARRRRAGLGTVGTIEALHRGAVKVFVSMGGNFALATPDLAYTFDALRNCDLTVQVSTKLNRSHIIHGKQALVFPCLARSGYGQSHDGRQQDTLAGVRRRL